MTTRFLELATAFNIFRNQVATGKKVNFMPCTNMEHVFYFRSRQKKKTYIDETSKGTPSKESGLSKISSKDLSDFEFRV